MICISTGKMKKMLFPLLFSFLLFIGGCGGSDNDTADSPICPGDPECPPEPVSFLSELLGTYELTGFTFRFENDGFEVNETDTEGWCGRIVVTSEGLIMYDLTTYSLPESFKWEILEITENTIKIREENCEKWLDYSRNGNDLTIIWPEGPCSEGFSATLNFTRISDSEIYPLPEECIPQQVADPIIPELVGTYEVLGFIMTAPADGSTFERTEPDDTWSGQMVLTPSNIIDLRATIDQANFQSVWEIDQVDDSDGDGVDDTLLLYDIECEFQADFVYESEDGHLTLTIPAGPCTDYIEMVYYFHKISDTVESLSSFAQLFKGTSLVKIQGPQKINEAFETRINSIP